MQGQPLDTWLERSCRSKAGRACRARFVSSLASPAKVYLRTTVALRCKDGPNMLQICCKYAANMLQIWQYALFARRFSELDCFHHCANTLLKRKNAPSKPICLLNHHETRCIQKSQDFAHFVRYFFWCSPLSTLALRGHRRYQKHMMQI